MIDWREVRAITLVTLGVMAFGLIGVGLVFVAYFAGALLAPAAGYVLAAVMFVVYEVSVIYICDRVEGLR